MPGYQEADTVADLEDQFGIGQQVGIATPDMDDRADDAFRETDVPKRLPDHGTARGEDAGIIEILAMARHPPWLQFTEKGDGCLQRVGIGTRRQQHIVLRQHQVLGRQAV